MIWLKVFGSLVLSVAKKITPMGVLVTVASLGLTYGMWQLKAYLSGVAALKLSVTELTLQNEQVLATNRDNAEALFTFKKSIQISDNITEKLIKKVEGIQNVQITEKTIIQTAQSNCLDVPYPDSIIHSRVLDWEEKPTAETSN